MPAALMRMSASSSPGSGFARSLIWTVPSSIRAAFTSTPLCCLVGSGGDHATVPGAPRSAADARTRPRRPLWASSGSHPTESRPVADGDGTPDHPWKLETPSGGSAYEAYRDEAADPAALMVQVGTTQLRYLLRCLDDLHAM